MPLAITINPFTPIALRMFKGAAAHTRWTLRRLKQRLPENGATKRSRPYSTRTVHHRLGVGVKFTPARRVKRLMPIHGPRIGYFIIDPMGDYNLGDFLSEARAAWAAIAPLRD